MIKANYFLKVVAGVLDGTDCDYLDKMQAICQDFYDVRDLQVDFYDDYAGSSTKELIAKKVAQVNKDFIGDIKSQIEARQTALSC